MKILILISYTTFYHKCANSVIIFCCWKIAIFNKPHNVLFCYFSLFRKQV